jgi:glycosyltransferase involved in cell wall biosynthesis
MTSRQTKIGIFTDHTGGVHVFSTRLAGQLKAERAREIHVVTYQAATPAEQLAVEELRSVSDSMHLLPRTGNDADLVRNICLALRQVRCDVFIPNYRSTTYAALARLTKRRLMSSRSRPPLPVLATSPGNRLVFRCPKVATRVVGICHDNNDAYYNLLAHYEPIVEVFVCPTLSTKAALEKRIPHRKGDIYCLPHGVPAFEDCEPEYEGGPLRLFYAGRLEETQKRVSYLIAIAAELERRSVPFTLSLVGDGPDRERYVKRVERSGLAGRVEFHGHCMPDQVKAVLRKSHLAVLTSMHEGFCYGLAEAMAAGLPAVAFSCDGVIEQYLKDGVNGCVVPWGDVKGAAERIAGFYDNPAKWRSFSARARREIETNYSMAAFGSAYSRLLDERLTRTDSPRSWPAMRPVLSGRNKGTMLTDRLGKYVRLW